MATAIASTDTEKLAQIRRMVWEELTEEHLPDSHISQSSRLGAATNEVFSILGLTQSSYDALSGDKKEVIDIAIMQKTSALIIPDVGQLIRESALQDSPAYAEINWKDKVEMRELSAAVQINIIQPDTVSTGSFVSVGVL